MNIYLLFSNYRIYKVKKPRSILELCVRRRIPIDYNLDTPYGVDMFACQKAVKNFNNISLIADEEEIIRADKPYLYCQTYSTQEPIEGFSTDWGSIESIYNDLVDNGLLIKEKTDLAVRNSSVVYLVEDGDLSVIIKSFGSMGDSITLHITVFKAGILFCKYKVVINSYKQVLDLEESKKHINKSIEEGIKNNSLTEPLSRYLIEKQVFNFNHIENLTIISFLLRNIDFNADDIFPTKWLAKMKLLGFDISVTVREQEISKYFGNEELTM